MPSQLQQLILEAKRLQRLQTERRKLRKQLRDKEKEIRLSAKHIKALKASGLDPDDPLPPQWKGRVK